MTRTVIGKTRYCCKSNCGSIATNWAGWLRKSRDYVAAGFCDLHKEPEQKCYGFYDKNLQIASEKTTEDFGLHKNIIEQ